MTYDIYFVVLPLPPPKAGRLGSIPQMEALLKFSKYLVDQKVCMWGLLARLEREILERYETGVQLEDSPMVGQAAT